MIPMQHIEKETLKLDLYRRLFSEMREGVMITDKNANILEINPAFTDISDYRQIDAIGKKPVFYNQDGTILIFIRPCGSLYWSADFGRVKFGISAKVEKFILSGYQYLL
jgi:PAS domain-containing protein